MKYTLETAPDYASRLALCRPVVRLTDGAAPGTGLATAVHANFARIIEQNFAGATAESVVRWLETVEAHSVAALAQTYLNATDHQGRSAWALDILAQRLDAQRLARLSAHFGFARTHAAVLRAAPGKLEAFNACATVRHPGPALGDMRLSAVASANAGAGLQATDHGIYVDYTIQEIYLAFRTAPIGATSLSAAMFQTGMVLGAALPLAWAPDQWLGRYCRLGMQVYTPSAWDVFADSASWWLHQLMTHPEAAPTSSVSAVARTGQQRGQLQRDGFMNVFQVEACLYDSFAIAGGDFLSAHEWAHCMPYEPYSPEGSVCGRPDAWHGQATRPDQRPSQEGVR